MYKIIDTDFIEVRGGMSIIRVVILCDNSSDVPEPLKNWDTGSICRIANEKKTLVLNNAREWV